jgi:hypothetical protein
MSNAQHDPQSSPDTAAPTTTNSLAGTPPLAGAHDVTTASPPAAAVEGPPAAPRDLTVVDPYHVDQIHRHIEHLFRARRGTSSLRPRDRNMMAGYLACLGYMGLLFCGVYVATATGHVLDAHVLQALWWSWVAALVIAFVLIALRLVLAAIPPFRDGPIHDYHFLRPRQPTEIQFVNTVKEYDESALRYVRGQSAWLAKHKGRMFGFALGRIILPFALGLAALIVGFKTGANTTLSAFLRNFFSPAWSIAPLAGIGLMTVYGLARFHDVESHERYEQLLEQAADLAALREAES